MQIFNRYIFIAELISFIAQRRQKNIFLFILLFLLNPFVLKCQTISQVQKIATLGTDVVGNIVVNRYWDRVFAGYINGYINLNYPLDYSGGYLSRFQNNTLFMIKCGDIYPTYELSSKMHVPAFAVAKNNEIYVCGFSVDTIRFGNFISPSSDSITFFARLLPNGLISIGCELSENLQIVDITVDEDYNIYLTGRITGPLNFHFCNTGPSFIPSNNLDIILIKMDTLSSIKWIREPVGNGLFENAAQAITCDKNGNVYISGHIHSDTQFDSLNFLSHDSTDYEGFVAKYDSAGAIQWVRYAGYDAIDLAVDSAGNCFVSGYSKSTSWFGDSMVMTASNHNLFLTKFNADGDLVWIRQGQSNGISQINSISLDSTSTVYATGFFRDTLSLGSIILLSSSCLPDTSQTTFVICLDSSGTEVWGKALTSCNASSQGLAIDAGECGIVVGGKIDFSNRAVYFDGDSLLSSGNSDGYFFSIDSCLTSGISATDKNEHELIIKPIPSNDLINVSGLQRGEEVVITNLMGEIMGRFFTEMDDVTLTIKNYSPGIYIIHSEHASNKFIKM